MDKTFLFETMIQMIHGEIRHLDTDGNIIRRYGNSRPEWDPFCTDQTFLQQILSRQNGFNGSQMSFGQQELEFFRENRFLYYGVIYLGNGEIILAGPVQISGNAAENAVWIKKQHRISDDDYKIPYCEVNTFLNGMLLLYYELTGKEIPLKRVLEQYGLDLKSEEERELNRKVFHMRETGIPHNPYDLEARKLDCIRRGDVEGVKACQTEAWVGALGKIADDPIRQEKNMAVIAIVLASRAAIQGGMPSELIFSVTDSLILKAERTDNILHIQAAVVQAEIDFARQVREIRKLESRNRHVQLAKEYVFAHLHEKITVEVISQCIGISRDYLSLLFKNSEGITLQQYICREKIRQAESMLKYTDSPISEIASCLSFSSQSYFGECFRKETGMTPANYRNQQMQYRIFDKNKR